MIYTMAEQDEDMGVTIEAGARSLYETSPPFVGKGDMWKWLTPAIRNRWRRRFRIALNKAMEAM